MEVLLPLYSRHQVRYQYRGMRVCRRPPCHSRLRVIISYLHSRRSLVLVRVRTAGGNLKLSLRLQCIRRRSMSILLKKTYRLICISSLAFSTEDLTPLLLHVHFYSDMLARWQLYHKRAELLKSISMPGEETALHEHSFGKYPW